MPAKKQRFHTFENQGAHCAIDLASVTHLEVATPAMAGVLDPTPRLHLYFGSSDVPFTISAPENMRTILKALDLQALQDMNYG
jgi:hypothetical protein